MKEADDLKKLQESNDKKCEGIESSSKAVVSFEMTSEIVTNTRNMLSYYEENFDNSHEVSTAKGDTNSKKSLYEKLKDVDPAMATCLLPSNS